LTFVIFLPLTEMVVCTGPNRICTTGPLYVFVVDFDVAARTVPGVIRTGWDGFQVPTAATVVEIATTTEPEPDDNSAVANHEEFEDPCGRQSREPTTGYQWAI
jgi:hypothetical protein